MKKHTGILIPAVFMLLFCIDTGTAQDNLIPNGGFESGDTIWVLSAEGGSEAEYEITSQDAIEGDSCLKVNVIQLGSNYWDVQFQNLNWGAVENQSYRFSIKGKSEPAGRRFNFIVLKATSPYTYYADNRDINLTSEWQTYSYTFTSPVTTEDDIMVVVHLTGSNTTYRFDDIRLYEEIVDNAQVRSNGTKIWISFTQEMQDPSGEPQITFIVTVNSTKTIKVDSVSLHPQYPNTIELELADTIYKFQDVQVTYYPGTIATQTGLEIGEFTVDALNSSQITTGVKELTEDMIQIFPNPVGDILTIKNLNPQEGLYGSIIGLTGQVIRKIDTGSNTIDVHDIKSGLYLIQLRNNDEYTRIYKFIKK